MTLATRPADAMKPLFSDSMRALLACRASVNHSGATLSSRTSSNSDTSRVNRLAYGLMSEGILESKVRHSFSPSSVFLPTSKLMAKSRHASSRFMRYQRVKASVFSDMLTLACALACTSFRNCSMAARPRAV